MVAVLPVALGGGIGSATRYLVAGWSARRFGPAFPYGTFVINVSGSFIIGLFLAFAQERGIAQPLLAPLLRGRLCRSLHNVFDF